jgi:hypothetical protein
MSRNHGTVAYRYILVSVPTGFSRHGVGTLATDLDVVTLPLGRARFELGSSKRSSGSALPGSLSAM